MFTSFLLIIVGIFFIVYGFTGVLKRRITVGRILPITATNKTAIFWGITDIILGIALIIAGGSMAFGNWL